MKEPIRYSKAECKDPKLIELFLRSAKSGQLGLFDGEYPYVIPMAFVWYKGAFYFHGSAEGKKNVILQKHTQTCFTISEDYGATIAPVPANINVAHMCVMAFGNLEEEENLESATEALNAMINKYVPGYYEKPMKADFLEKYRSSMGSRTVTWKLIPQHLSAKAHSHDPFKMFFGGRTRESDVEMGIK